MPLSSKENLFSSLCASLYAWMKHTDGDNSLYFALDDRESC